MMAEFKIRANRKRWKKIEEVLPNMSNEKRLDHLIESSVPGAEIQLKEMGLLKPINKMGEIIYGKKLWKRQKR